MTHTFHAFSDHVLRGLPMPELRKDPIVGRWVIIAIDRAKRPITARNEPPAGDGAPCPFCAGREGETDRKSTRLNSSH